MRWVRRCAFGDYSGLNGVDADLELVVKVEHVLAMENEPQKWKVSS